MSEIDIIKENVKKLYETSPSIHVNITTTRPKLVVRNAPAVIKGVYSNIFTVEESSAGYRRTHSIQYSALLIGQVEILELI